MATIVYKFFLALFIAVFTTACSERMQEARLQDARPKSDCDPGNAIDEVFATLKKVSSLSELIAKSFRSGVTLDAVQSPSAQSSDGPADPRIIIRSGCVIFTFTLLGTSLELGIQDQTADVPLPDIDQTNPELLDPDNPPKYLSGGLSKQLGQILVEIKDPFADTLVPSDLVSHWDPKMNRNDSNECTDCHLNLDHLQHGQKIIRAGKESFLALVNPLAHEGEESAGYCIPKDLQYIYDCACKSTSPSCNHLKPPFPDHEGDSCARLAAILKLNPTPLHLFHPSVDKNGKHKCIEI